MSKQSPKAQISPCPQCGGKRVGGLVRASGLSPWSYLSYHSFTTMKRRRVGDMWACACTACGYVAWYVNPQELAKALQKHPGEFLS
jgi:hypothetical protein